MKTRIRTASKRTRNAWNALLGRPVIILHDGSVVENVTVHGSFLIDGSNVRIRKSMFNG